MREASVPPQIIYAYKRTGLLLMEELEDQYPPDAVAEWNAAIGEYFDGQADNGTSKYEKYARWDEYALEGETLGEVTVKIAGAEVTRPIKIVWQHTPDWEHYDEKHQELIPDDGAYEGLNFKAQVRADPMDSVFEKDASDPKNAPCWDRIGLVEDGILGRTVENAIEADIKRQCKDMDQKPRKKYLKA